MERAANMLRKSKFQLLIGVPILVWMMSVIGSATGAGNTAPELTGRHWLNSAPLTIAGLKGRVVLVEFWTYG